MARLSLRPRRPGVGAVGPALVRGRRRVALGAGAALVATAALVAPSGPAVATTPGWVDRSYGPGGGAVLGGSVSALAADRSGAVYAATRRRDSDLWQLQRRTPTGALDPGFGAAGTLTLPGADQRLPTVTTDALGRPVVVQQHGAAGSTTLTRWTTSGRPDPTFGTGGSVTLPGVWGQDVAVRPGNAVAVLGSGNGGLVVVGLDAAGRPDPAWAPGAATPGAAAVGGPYTVGELATDGRRIVVLAGRPSSGPGDPVTSAVVRLTATGQRDRTFAGSGRYPFAGGLSPRHVTVRSSVVTASFVRGDRVVVARLTSAGAADTGFGGTGQVELTPPWVDEPDRLCGGGIDGNVPVVDQGDGILVASNASDCPGTVAVQRLRSDGSPDSSYGAGGQVVLSDLDAVAFPRLLEAVDTAQGLVLAVERRTEALLVRVRRTSEVAAGGFMPLVPTRVVDTRRALGAPAALGPGEATTVTLAGRGGVPGSGASAVVLTVTATAPTRPGYLSVVPAGTSRTGVSTVNFAAGQDVAAGAVVRLGTGGAITIGHGGAGTVQLVVDVVGYFTDGTPTDAGAYHSTAPSRILDTRRGLGARTLTGGGTARLAVAGRGGIPAPGGAAGTGPAAVALTLTATNATSGGPVAAFPGGVAAPNVSQLTVTPGLTTADLVIVPVAADGTIALRWGGTGPLDLVADVAGWFADGDATRPGTFVPIVPTRFLDTRLPRGWPSVVRPVLPPEFLTLDPTYAAGVPTSGVSGVVLTVTTTGQTQPGYAAVHPSYALQVATSTLVWPAGRTVSATTLVGTDRSQALLTARGRGRLDVVADVSGWFLR